MSELNGKGRQVCTLCSCRSVAGLIRGHGKCPFHWLSGIYDLDYASKIFPTHKQAKPLHLIVGWPTIK